MSDNPIYDEVKAESETPVYNGVNKPDLILGPITGSSETMDEPSKKPQAKVVAATVGAGVGVAVSVVLIYIIEALSGSDIPNPVEDSIAVIITAGLAFIGGYFKRNNNG